MKALKSHIDNNGRLAIPVKLRKMLHLKNGDQVMISCVDNKLVITTYQEKLAEARAIIKKYSNLNLLEELKKMRAEDAAKE